jgi:hypothetical protein
MCDAFSLTTHTMPFLNPNPPSGIDVRPPKPVDSAHATNEIEDKT